MLDEILLLTKDIPYMDESQARELSKIINNYDIENLCELGTYQGKGTILAAAIMEERGKGQITTFDSKRMIDNISPNVTQLAKRYRLSHRINTVVAEISYGWELAKQIESNPEPIYDCVYIDGSHDYAGTALQFYLSRELAKPGCIFIFDDIDWCAAKTESIDYYSKVVCSSEWNEFSVNLFVNHAVRQGHLKEIDTDCDKWRVLSC